MGLDMEAPSCSGCLLNCGGDLGFRELHCDTFGVLAPANAFGANERNVRQPYVVG
jgi:hypothetical protein